MSALRTFCSDAVFRASLFECIAFVDVAGSTDESHIRKMEEAFLLLHRQHGDVGVLCIVRGTAPLPGASARSYASHVVRMHGDWLKLGALVMEDSGVVTQLFSSLVRGVNLLAGRSRLNVFPDLLAAETALVGLLFPGAQRASMLESLDAAVQAAHADYNPHAPGSAA